MIKSITIENFRGIPSLTLDELTPLVVLVGPNGCGKSTVLDAMLLGASGSPGDAVGRAVQRRDLRGGARWLFPKGGHLQVTPTITAQIEGRELRVTRLKLRSHPSPENERKLLDERLPAPFVEVVAEIATGDRASGSEPERAREAPSPAEAWAQQPHAVSVAFSAESNAYVMTSSGSADDMPDACLVEPRSFAAQVPLARNFSVAWRAGREDEMNALLAEILPGSPRLALLVDDTDAPVVHLTYRDGAIPVAISGDGVATLVRLICELTLPTGSTALIEEPEVHQHPRALRQTARAMVAAVRRGVQVVLSTHSLELIDELLGALGEADRSLLSLYGMAKRKKDVVAVREAGADVAFARERIGEDLR